MEFRTIQLNIISAKDIKKVNRFSKQHVYAVVSIIGDPYLNNKAKTPIHKNAGDSPSWNFPIQLTFNETLSKQNRLTLFIQLISHRSFLGDKEIGTVRISVNDLVNRAGDDKSFQNLAYDVRKPSGKSKGVLNLSYKLGDIFTPPAPAPAVVSPKGEPAMAYPPPPYYGPPPPYGYGYAGQPGYGGYPPPGYGPGPAQYGYGPGPAQYGYGPGPVQQQGRKNNNFGMGLGAGLLGGALGGMLIGDMISDAGAYDAGYDAGFDDGGGFDF